MILQLHNTLESYKSHILCTCLTKYTYNAVSDVMQRKIQDWVVQFTREINEQYISMLDLESLDGSLTLL